jgi:shikimate kinase
MGAGKTTVGRALAHELGRPFLDNDVLLGEAASTIQAAEGLDALHAREAQAALRALAEPEPAVIALAASAIESPQVRAALAGHLVVWLTADAEVRADRTPGGGHRPILEEDPARRRARRYAPMADLVIDTGVTSVTASVRRVARCLGAG